MTMVVGRFWLSVYGACICAGLCADISTGLAADFDQDCIFASASRLPRIPGLVVKKSQATKMPAPKGWNADAPPTRVDIDFSAAGQEGRYSFLCAIVVGAAPIVTRIPSDQ